MDKESTIDIEFIDRDLSNTAATRQSFRIPVDQKENLSVIMKGKTDEQ